MSIYSDTTADGMYQRILWHPSLPLLAALGETGSQASIDLYSADGQRIPLDGSTGSSGSPTSIAWHPQKPILAIGYSNGKLLLKHGSI